MVIDPSTARTTYTRPTGEPEAVSTTTRLELAGAISTALVGRALLEHPFYRRWEAGRLAPGELASYAAQYRPFEAILPAVLSAVTERLAEEGSTDAAELAARNLEDELGRPGPHLALFDRFADAVADGAPLGRPGPAAETLVVTYRGLVDEGPVAALAGLAAYETQASAIARTKAEGLRRWYGIGASGTEFWDVHAELDADHGEWAIDALVMAGAGATEVRAAAGTAADGWWALLDEREAEAPCSAQLGTHD